MGYRSKAWVKRSNRFGITDVNVDYLIIVNVFLLFGVHQFY